jgi:hypothetical protein
VSDQPASDGSAPSSALSSAPSSAASSAARLRTVRKELAATERQLDRAAAQVAAIHERMAAHDPADYQGLTVLTDELRATQSRTETLETRWLELSDQL